MNTNSDAKVLQNLEPRKRRFVSWVILPLAFIAAGMLAGCKTEYFPSAQVVNAQVSKAAEMEAKTSGLVNLREGDVLKISFPGSPSMDTTEQIRPDGKIRMPLIGEVEAAGMTPAALETKLVETYKDQLSTKEVTVEVENSAFPIYITGMVLRPGKILSDHPLTALDAIMEAGGFDEARANAKNVVVIRRVGSVMKNYTLNLRAVLEGKQSEPFYLKPGDIVYVPERFTMF